MGNQRIKKLLALSLVFSMVAGSVMGGSSSQAAGKAVSVQNSAQKKAQENQNYVNNQGKLQENPLIQLPLGAVKAESWLENQLLLMKNGITGNMKYFHDYNSDGSAWLGSTKPGANTWENGPYFLRGLTALAYALNDKELIEETLQWIGWAVDSQQPNGYFGPVNDNSWWARMPVLCAIRDFYEAIERKPLAERSVEETRIHSKILDFFESYFRYQEHELPGRPLSNWADARGGDNLEIVYWLYNQIYHEDNPDKTDWLLDLGDLIYRQTFDWENEYNQTTVRLHVVNTSQGMKTPAVYAQYKGDEKYRIALSNGIDHMGIDHGRIDGLPNSDEAARENRSTRGSETCGTVEGLLSTEISMKILGESWMGDRIETLAYNALPAAYPSDYSGHAYYILQNQVMNTLGNHEFDCDHGDSSAFGAPNGYDCCFSNNHMGWAKFVQNMWMAKANGGLSIIAYGPNSVEAKVAHGKTAKFQQKTDYPFRDTVNLDYYGESASFDLDLRIPEWAKSAEVKVNGAAQSGVATGSYYTVNRLWEPGDKVTVTFKSEVELTTWYNNSTAVQKGALIYGLKIDEDWRTYDGNDARELKVEHKDDLPLREVYPASPWNYGLITDENASFEVMESPEVALQPFNSGDAPVKIIAKGQRLPEWTLDGNIAGPQPYGPVDYDANEIEEITLVPYGCQRLRVTHFPTLSKEEELNAIVRTQGTRITRNGKVYQDFDNLVVPKAQDYSLKVTAEGSGKVIINSKFSQNVDGSFEITGLKEKLSGGFKFDAGHYNNIRFTGAIQISEVRVEVIGREITEAEVINVTRSGSTCKIITNLDPQETPYRVVYGTEPGNYTNTVRGFSSSTATLQDLEDKTAYYAKVISTICGVEKESKEVILEVSEGQGGLKPNPNVPTVTYEGFTTLNYMTGEEGLWNAWGETTIQAKTHEHTEKASEIKFGKSDGQKAILVAKGAQNWVDYVAEADLTLDEVAGNNAGMMFRVTDAGEGPDAYHGYYAGIGIVNGEPGLMIGYADGGWHDIDLIQGLDIQANQKYTIKVIVYSDMFAVYLDGTLIKVVQDGRFAKGSVGLRSYKVPFTGHDVRVRSVAEEDLTVFETLMPEEPEEPEEPPVIPDFKDDFTTDEAWTKVGQTDLIQIRDGQLELGKSNNVKAAAGDEAWSDMVYSADVTLREGDGNAGLLVRVSKAGSGADNYYGYYFGINGEEYEIGKASNNWKRLKIGDLALDTGTAHRLKVMAYGNILVFYVDDELVDVVIDSDHVKGSAGVRGYNRSFAVDNVEVRGLADAEKEEAVKQEEVSKQMEISGYSASESIQVKYPRIINATSYRVLFGTESGRYTDEFTDVFFNGYKGSGIFTHDKVAFSTLNPGTYYVKVIGMNGNTAVSYSNEVVVTTDERADTQVESEKLAKAMDAADAFDLSLFTALSRKRFDRANVFADRVNGNQEVNQMDVATAADLLAIAMNTPDSTEFAPEEVTVNKAELQNFYNQQKNKKENDYTAESWKPFAEAMRRAETVLEDAEADQAAVDAAERALRDAANGLVRNESLTEEALEEAIRKAEEAQKAAEETAKQAQAAKAAAEKLAEEAEAAKQAAIEAQKKAEEMANASGAEKEAAEKAAREAAEKAKEAAEKATAAEEAVKAAREAQAAAEEAVRLSRLEAEAIRKEWKAAQDELEKAKEAAQKAKEEAEQSRKKAEEAAKKAEEALNALQEARNAAKNGQTYTVGSLKYKVISAAGKKAAVTGMAKKNLAKVTVPDTVLIKGTVYQVTSVGNNAFRGSRRLTRLTLGKNMISIGNRAFCHAKKLKQITVRSEKLRFVGKNACKGIAQRATVNVPDQKVKTYRRLFRKAGQPKDAKIK